MTSIPSPHSTEDPTQERPPADRAALAFRLLRTVFTVAPIASGLVRTGSHR